MVNIKPTINIYDDEGNLSKAYDKAINKMIDQTFDIDLEQFDFDEVAKGKCKEFDDLVTKLCAKSGLGSADIYSILLERFIAEYDMDYDVNYVYGLDELEESKKTTKKILKESKNHKLIEYFDKAIPHYNIAIRDIDSDSELFFGEMKDLKTCSYKNFTVLEHGINSPHYEDIDCLVFYIDLKEDAFEESKKTTKRSLKESKNSIRFEDFLMLNNEPDEEFRVHVNDVHYCTCDKENIFNFHDELLQREILEWCCASSKGNKVIVWLK